VKKARRTWLFVPGADENAHEAAAKSTADVLIQELEDFTPVSMRARARDLAMQLYARWRAAGKVVAVRVNPLETCGRDDLGAVLAAKPDVVMMSKVAKPEHVRALADIAGTTVELVPNIESAAGLVRTIDIVHAARNVTAALMASEDMVADLGAARTREGGELAYARARFLVECRAAGVEAIDCPYTFSDARGAANDARYAKALGYRAKSLVSPAHADAVNRVFAPSASEIAHARRVVAAFEKAREAGRERAHVGGALVEVPIYAAAKRLLEQQE
jgi:citrate lyase subunit beta/citryl-CoA lyase